MLEEGILLFNEIGAISKTMSENCHVRRSSFYYTHLFSTELIYGPQRHSIRDELT